MMQTEYNAAFNFRTHDNGAGGYGWGRSIFSNQGVKWTVQNGQYPDQGYLGPWEGQFVDGAEVAFNKQNDLIGYFNISQILRGEYVATYEDLTSVNYNNPLDITYVLENEGGERLSTIGWKNTGAGWQSQANKALTGVVGNRYLESWNGNGLEATDFYQEIYGLPEGYYRFSAIAHCSADCYIYANAEQTAMPTNNPGTRINAVVQVTGSDGYLKVGAKTGDNPGKWIAFDEAKLEYLGTSIPSAYVGTPTPSVPDGGYIQNLTTFDFTFNEAASDTYTFALLNSSANVTFAKNGTTIASGSLTLDGKKLTASFNGVTLETNTDYTLTLPADVVGYAGVMANEAVTLTLHTPVVWDGTYYLYNPYNGKYISRGGQWATAAILDDWGLALILNTDAEGKTTLKYFDSQRYLYNDGFCYGDGTSGLQLTMSQVTDGYKFLNNSNNCYLAVWGGRAVGDAAEGGNLEGTSNIWTLESTADHVANYTRCEDLQAAAAASADGIVNITTKAQLETLVNNSNDYYTVTVDEQEKKAEQYEIYAARANDLTEAEYEKFTVNDVKPGLYRLSIDAFQRAAWFDWVAQADGARGCIYLYANDAKTQIKSVMEHYSSTAYQQNWALDADHNYINGIPEAYDVLEEGYYNNVVYVYVPADEGSSTGTITYGINNPNRLADDYKQGTWCCYHTFKLEYLMPVVTLDELSPTAPAEATGVNVRFLRSIIDKNNGKTEEQEEGNAWNTICFPFSLNSSQITAIFGEGTEVKELTGVTPVGENSSLTFTDVTSISANTPYIMQVQPGNAKTEYIIENIDITPSTDLTVTVDGLDFIGNYTYNTETPLIPQGDFYLLNDKFKQSKNGTKLKGFRAYFHIPAGSPIKALGFYDGSATGIESLDAYNIVLPADIYTIGGQLVRKNADSLDNLPAGIYFINGKKVLKR